MKDLSTGEIDYQFIDLRKDGLVKNDLKKWVASAGWKVLLNTRGLTWRGLTEVEKEIVDERKAIALMFKYPALIKRPVFEIGSKVIIGYKDNQKKALGL